MELMAKIDLFILQGLEAKLGKSIPRVQMFLAKIYPLQLFELWGYSSDYASALFLP